MTENSFITETIYNMHTHNADDSFVFKIEYHLKDLPIIIGRGNVRAILTDSETKPALPAETKCRKETPELIQQSHYYPFLSAIAKAEEDGQEFMGMQLAQIGEVNNYKYNLPSRPMSIS